MDIVVSENEKIRALNDAFRQTFSGGTVMLTAGMLSLPAEVRQCLIEAVQQYDAFTPENDPYGEHDCAIVDADGHRVLFKIDYYDLELLHHSDDPTDPEQTRRVLTIMLPEEY